jgi:hypothetical protein
MYVRWTTFSCTNCKKELGKLVVASQVRLGPEVQACPRCAQPFRSTRREWIQLSAWRKIEYFFSLWTIAFFVVAGVFGLAGFLAPVGIAWGLLCACLLCTPLWTYKIFQIRSSMDRTIGLKRIGE